MPIQWIMSKDARTHTALRQHAQACLELIDQNLHHASDVAAAARFAADVIGSHPDFRAAVYFVNGERLRCYAHRGYAHIQDGVLAGSGLVGRCFSSGMTRSERTANYSIVSASAVFGGPGKMIGVVTIEVDKARELDASAKKRQRDHWVTTDNERLCEQIAMRLGLRVQAMGGLPILGKDRMASSIALQLVSTTDPSDIANIAARGATLVTDFDTSVVVLALEAGYTVVASHGPGTWLIESLTDSDLDVLAHLARPGTSGVADCAMTHGVDANPLLRLGARAGVWTPIAIGGQLLGMVIAASTPESIGEIGTASTPCDPIDVDDVCRLELLSAHTAACLSTARSMQILIDRAERDPLTGLRHRGAFRAELTNRLAVASPAALVVMLVDFDHFKEINDIYGHAAGDAALKRTVKLIGRSLRSDDSLYRIGGDEFAIVLEVGNIVDGDVVTDRVLREVVAGSMHTVSIGWTTATAEDTPDTILERCDYALYCSKTAGRNRATYIDGVDVIGPRRHHGVGALGDGPLTIPLPATIVQVGAESATDQL